MQLHRFSYSFVLGIMCVLAALIMAGCCDCDDPPEDICTDPDCLSKCNFEAECNRLQDPLLLSLNLTSPVTAVGDIDEAQRRVIITVPHGTDLSNARASFSASQGAELSPNPTNGLDLRSRSMDLTLQTSIASKTYRLQVRIERPDLPSFAEGWYKVFNNQGIGAACAIEKNGDDAYLFNRAGDRYVEVKNGFAREYSLSGGSGPLRDCAPLTGLTAAQIAPSGNHYFFSRDGKQWQVRRNVNDCGTSDLLSSYGQANSHPFRLIGVEAALMYKVTGKPDRTFHFSRATSQYHTLASGSFTSPDPVREWGVNIPFSRVGAAMHLRVNLRELYPDRVSTNQFESVQVIFNEAGTHFACYHYERNQGRPYGFSDVYPIVEE